MTPTGGDGHQIAGFLETGIAPVLAKLVGSSIVGIEASNRSAWTDARFTFGGGLILEVLDVLRVEPWVLRLPDITIVPPLTEFDLPGQ